MGDLIRLLACLYEDSERARLVAHAAGLDPLSELDFGGAPVIFWMRIVERAARLERVPALIRAAQADFPNVIFPAWQPPVIAADPPLLDGLGVLTNAQRLHLCMEWLCLPREAFDGNQSPAWEFDVGNGRRIRVQVLIGPFKNPDVRRHVESLRDLIAMHVEVIDNLRQAAQMPAAVQFPLATAIQRKQRELGGVYAELLDQLEGLVSDVRHV